MTIELGGASLQEGAMDGLALLEVYVGAEKIWPTGPRVVTIATNQFGWWDQGTVSGDADLIASWVGYDSVRFEVNVTCNKTVYAGRGAPRSAGTVLSAGADIGAYDNGTHIFTEVL